MDYCGEISTVLKVLIGINPNVIILRNPPYSADQKAYGQAIVNIFEWAKSSGRRMLVTFRRNDVDAGADEIIKTLTAIGQVVPDPFDRSEHYQDDFMFMV